MPLDKSLKKVLIIGSGPIVIGQAAEFDYAGTQACRALRELGTEVVLVNSNPATIMTDCDIAGRVYIEPLTEGFLRRIIEKERPDAVLPTFGGQIGLTLASRLARDGWLASRGVRLIGASLETIERAENRRLFKEMLAKIGEPALPSLSADSIEEAMAAARSVGYPVIVRPSFTLAGTGGGIAACDEEMVRVASRGLRASPVGQILVERSVAGWKEIEFEVMRDAAGNSVAVCAMENLDPAGVHTGDSIVAAPTLTLADREFQTLRAAALKIVGELGVQGGCNVQFALDPHSFDYAVIEVNPRVSRSSALASKATGYPIAKTAAQVAMGLRLDEIVNPVTSAGTAFFEPALDYVAVKMPRWPFDKFSSASRELGPQMKATGETMAIAPTFAEALMKAVRGAEIGADTLRSLSLSAGDPEKELRRAPTDRRLFAVYAALERGVTPEQIHELTKIDPWFTRQMAGILAAERELRSCRGALTDELYRRARMAGFTDGAIGRISGAPVPARLAPVYKMVDTCAAEFPAETPYFYGTVPAGEDGRDEAGPFIRHAAKKSKGTIVVLGGGPIRIGQGIEFDYAAVRCVWALKRLGYSVAMINSNPETVSTDFDVADRLYFEPLTPEDVMDVIRRENPLGVIAAFGGQTAIGLARRLSENGVNILGTPASAIDAAEDRGIFDAILRRCGVSRPEGRAARTADEALAAAREVGYPVLVRPSFVLGGRNMSIAEDDAALKRYVERVLASGAEGPVLIDRYIEGTEAEVDAVCDGADVLIPGIMEHVERAGVHSGDSIAVFPDRRLSVAAREKIAEATAKIGRELGVRGLMNVQFVMRGGEVFVIECNPRASRTVPFVSKVSGLPLVDIAVRVMLAGIDPAAPRLRDLPCGTGLLRPGPYWGVKAPAFSFDKLPGADVRLGPEMKSTGEVLGVGKSPDAALWKAFAAAGFAMRPPRGVLLSARGHDAEEAVHVARGFAALGCMIFALGETVALLRGCGVPCEAVSAQAAADLLERGSVDLLLACAAIPDETALLERAAFLHVPFMTCLDTAAAFAGALRSGYDERGVELVEMSRLARRWEI